MRTPLERALAALGDLYRASDLRRLGFAYLTSLVALWAYGIAISVYAFDIGGAGLVGIAAVIRLVPAAIVAPFAAGLADRYPRRRVLVLTDLTRAILVGGVCAAVASGAPPAVVFTIAGINTIISTPFEPAKNALTPDLAETPDQLTAANTAMSAFESVSIFVGPALGGLVLAASSIQVVFGITALLLLFSAAQVTRIGHSAADERTEPAEEAERVSGPLAGFRAIGRDWQLRTIVTLFSAQLLVNGLLMVLTVSVAIDLLDMGRPGVGYLNSAIGIGGLIGAGATLALTGRRGLGGLFAIGLVGWGVPIALIGFLPYTVVALLLLTCLGVANTLVDATALTLLQRAAPPGVAARVFGVLESLIIGSIAAGTLLAPLLLETLGIRGALVCSGVILPLLAILARPALHRIDAATPAPERRLELLRAIPMFAPLGPVPLEELAARLESVRHRAGVEIVRQGEAGDRFFIIDSGQVEVLEDGATIRRDGPGGHFGEIALLRDVPRTATVLAETDVVLLALGRDDFLEAVTRDSLSTQAAEAVVASRLDTARSR